MPELSVEDPEVCALPRGVVLQVVDVGAVTMGIVRYVAVEVVCAGLDSVPASDLFRQSQRDGNLARSTKIRVVNGAKKRSPFGHACVVQCLEVSGGGDTVGFLGRRGRSWFLLARPWRPSACSINADVFGQTGRRPFTT